MKTFRFVFLFSLLFILTSCNFLTSSDSSKTVDAEKETVDKMADTSEATESVFQAGTYKWEKDGVIMGGLDLTDPQANSFTFMVQAYDGQNVGELSGKAEVDGDVATYTNPENADCKATFGWKDNQLAIDTSEACQSLNGTDVSFTGIYTLIPVGTSSTSSEQENGKAESTWQEAVYIDPSYDRGNLSISEVSTDSFQFVIDVSKSGQGGELKGTATINGDEATFEDTEDPTCKGTFMNKDNVITFTEDSCLNYHDAEVGFNGEYTLTDQAPVATENDDSKTSCETSPFHVELLKFAEEGHLKDASIFLGMSEDALKQTKPAMTYDDVLYEGIPGYYDDMYTYLTANHEVFNLRYNALSEGSAVPYQDVVCQFGEPDEVVFNELNSEYFHVYNAGENKLSFVSDTKEGAIKAVELESKEDKLKINPIQD